MAILAIHTDHFKLLNLAISCKNLNDKYPDTTGMKLNKILWRNQMAEKECATCKFRAKFDTRPKSFLGRLWRWHAGWCPGFKAYLFSLPENERKDLAQRYGLAKYGNTQ